MMVGRSVGLLLYFFKAGKLPFHSSIEALYNLCIKYIIVWLHSKARWIEPSYYVDNLPIRSYVNALELMHTYRKLHGDLFHADAVFQYYKLGRVPSEPLLQRQPPLRAPWPTQDEYKAEKRLIFLFCTLLELFRNSQKESIVSDGGISYIYAFSMHIFNIDYSIDKWSNKYTK